MTFTTFTFLLFLAGVFALYWLLRGRTPQNALLVVASYLFYGWWDWRFCFLMLASSLVDYAVGLALERTERRRPRRLLLIASLVANIGLLGFFKYFNFFAENLHALATSVGWRMHPVELEIILPVGISFYTFQTLSYTIDIYRRRIPATRRIIDYLAYVSFFPQLVAGPIERASHLLPQFHAPRRFDERLARDGLRQMLWGVFKKMVIADNLALIVDPVYADPSAHGGPTLALATVCFALQIYADFSGYSDIAIGTARLFGIDLMRNFAYPYFAQSVAEFWRRWHISLSTWFRDYVYIPLGGSRAGPVRRCANAMITFIVSGFWHGASWNFGIWGAINGAAVLPAILRRDDRTLRASDTPGGEALIPAPMVVARMAWTFLIICIAWVFFRATTFEDALTILGRIVTTLPSAEAWASLKIEPAARTALLHALLLLAVEWIARRRLHPLERLSVPRALRWLIYTAIIWDILKYGTLATGTFIYFQF